MSVSDQGAHTLWPCGQGGPRRHQVWPPCYPSSTPLRTPCMCWKNRDFGLRGVQFREYFQNNFSGIQKQKQELALWHLVNRLVPENA